MVLRLRHTLVLLLFVLLPFHALFVTAGTKALLGPGHAPLPWLAIWKELIIAALFVVGIVELWLVERKTIAQILRGGVRWTWQLQRETWLVLALLTVAFLVSATSYKLQATSFAFGFRYTLLPLIFFLLLRNLAWDNEFLERTLFPALMAVGGIVALYGVVTFFPPQGFFTALGYSDAHSLYAPGSPLSAFQQVSGTGIRRIQSTFAGPNQLGLWLLIPWSVALVFFLQRLNTKMRKYENTKMNSAFTHLRIYAFTHFSILVLIGAALLLTFSRSAWIAAFVITLVACWMMLRGRTRTVALSSVVGVAVVALVVVAMFSPQLLLRSISNRHHVERVRAGIVAMVEKPLGHGLGTAGPASNRVSDPCVYFDEGADIGWAKDRPDLCLFVAGAQVQPPLPSGELRPASQPLATEKTCTCPVLPENWYLQIGYELGMAGFVLFITLTLFLLRSLQATGYKLQAFKGSPPLSVFLVFLGISIAALFLHAWEDSAVAYTAWGIVGIVLSRSTNNPRAAVPAEQMPAGHPPPRT